jgi:hypothetical protein
MWLICPCQVQFALAIERVFEYHESVELRGTAAAGVVEPTPTELALDALSTSLDHLVKIVEDGGLDAFDDAGLVGFLQDFERVRNRLPLVDHRVIGDATRRGLPDPLCQGSMARVLASALRISMPETTLPPCPTPSLPRCWLSDLVFGSAGSRFWTGCRCGRRPAS